MYSQSRFHQPALHRSTGIELTHSHHKQAPLILSCTCCEMVKTVKNRRTYSTTSFFNRVSLKYILTNTPSWNLASQIHPNLTIYAIAYNVHHHIISEHCEISLRAILHLIILCSSNFITSFQKLKCFSLKM